MWMRLWDIRGLQKEEACRYKPIECLCSEGDFGAVRYRVGRHVHEILTRPLVQSHQSLNMGLCLES